MSATPKVLFRGAATLTTTTTLYTTPAATTTMVSSLIVANTDTTSHTFTMALGGVSIATDVPVPPNSVLVFDFKQVLVATNIIQGGSDSTTVTFNISGVEIA
jgi:hypothetical protein